MRRELHLDDFEPPALSFNLSATEEGGKQHRGMYTEDFKMKDMRVETMIRNS